ncbi:MAG: Nif3-like dinuclear metal center hexameric protein, partial [Bacillota bacterium]
MKVREIIGGIIQKTGVPRLPEDKTCDHLMAGSLDSEVKKIGSTFMATVDVIREAAAQGVNFIITHEPTWFTGKDDTEWLEGDSVY